MAKTKEVTTVNSTLEILPKERANYEEITEATVIDLIERAKNVNEMKAGLPTPDSIEYLKIDEEVKEGGKIRLTYLATTVEERIEEETGEISMLPVAVVIDEQGRFWKNATFMFVRHFASRASGYQAEMTFVRYRKTKTGNKMQQLEFRPLGIAA